MADIQALISALDVFSRAPDKASLDNANSWLQDFQHSPEAWTACNVLLQNPDAPPAAKLFAAQTFRTKVTYDLHQVASENLPTLRDTLLAALERHHGGPRTIIVQLCLALSGLALQFPAWENPVQDMIDTLGMNPGTVPTLLQFLTNLPEELNGNTRIPITDEEFRERADLLLTKNAHKLLELLSMYYQAGGVTMSVRRQIFDCLRSWLIAGEVSGYDFAQTPLFGGVFEALSSDELFDSSVDVICELIHETQEIDDNMPVIELIVPRLIVLKPEIARSQEDADRIRGYARIFAEAGETYRMLLLEHTETFFPIVEAIGECSAHPDLDIVPITFPFWMRLAQSTRRKTAISPLFFDAYRSLMQVILTHLRFPEDLATLSDQETEAFRSFRHVMGDTLKDCCYVLRTENCLLATREIITAALARGADVTWQEVEAPLFAMRSMGAEVDPNDDMAVPQIMDLIPLLPTHPRVRYAALLIISRYSEWVNAHPSYLPGLLAYISTGFESSDTEVSAAAGQALKYICQDCKKHLVDFLPTLHTFLTSTGGKLAQEDRRQVYEAIGHVISAMKMEAAAESLRTFAFDILAQLHGIATQPTRPSKAELQESSNGLENLETMLHVVQGFGSELPSACQQTCEQSWRIFDAFIVKFGADPEISDRVTRVVRRGIVLFGDAALVVAPSIIARMSFSFEATGLASYLWIPGKLISRFGNDDDPNLRGSFKEFYERSTQKVVSLLQTNSPREIADVLEDYIQMLVQLEVMAPDIFFESSSFPLAFGAALAGFQVVQADTIFATLELTLNMIMHDCLDPTSHHNLPKYPLYAVAIKRTIEKEGYNLLGYLLAGLTGNFPEDAAANIVSIFRALAPLWPSQLVVWLRAVLEQLPPGSAPNEVKLQFLNEVTEAINKEEYDKVKYAILSFTRSSRKARERRRV